MWPYRQMKKGANYSINKVKRGTKRTLCKIKHAISTSKFSYEQKYGRGEFFAYSFFNRTKTLPNPAQYKKIFGEYNASSPEGIGFRDAVNKMYTNYINHDPILGKEAHNSFRDNKIAPFLILMNVMQWIL